MPPRTAADRPRALPAPYPLYCTRGMDVYDRYLAKLRPIGRPCTRPPWPQGHLGGALSDVPSVTVYGGGRDRETGTRDMNAAIAPASSVMSVDRADEKMAETAR